MSCQILRSKYLLNGSFFQSGSAGASQFWKGLHGVSKWARRGIAYRLGNGKKICFWKDVWLGQVPLGICFPTIYNFCDNPEVLVSEVIRGDGLVLNFRRSFGASEVEEWHQLQFALEGVTLSDQEDEGYWALNSNGKYTSKSMYEEVVNPGLRDTRMVDMWKSNMPLKVKIFVWMCVRGRIQVAKDLKEKGWLGEPSCKLRGEEESADHLVFSCPLSHFCWWWIALALNWEKPPSNFEEFANMGLGSPGARSNFLGWSLLGAVAWTIWLSRNDFVFNNKLSNSPATNVYKMISLLSQWKLLLPEKRKQDGLQMLEQLRNSSKNLFFLLRPRSGVG